MWGCWLAQRTELDSCGRQRFNARATGGRRVNSAKNWVSHTHRILKYLAKLALPPLPKRLKAMVGGHSAVGGSIG